MPKFLVKIHVVYEKQVFVVANNKEDAKTKVENKEGIQVGLVKYVGNEQVVDAVDTKLDIKY